MTSKIGMKETLEIFDAVDAAIAAYEDAMKDGEINLWDLPKLARVVGPIREAVKDIKLVKIEIADADMVETQVCLERLVKLALLIAKAME